MRFGYLIIVFETRKWMYIHKTIKISWFCLRFPSLYAVGLYILWSSLINKLPQTKGFFLIEIIYTRPINHTIHSNKLIAINFKLKQSITRIKQNIFLNKRATKYLFTGQVTRVRVSDANIFPHSVFTIVMELNRQCIKVKTVMQYLWSFHNDYFLIIGFDVLFYDEP